MAFRRSLDFLPSFFRTDTNSKFLNATLDQMISEPDMIRLDGYVGRKFAPSYQQGDGYVVEPTVTRQNYQLEPATVYRDDSETIRLVTGYQDLLGRIDSLGGITTDHSRMFASKQYSYSGAFDFDKFANYASYYWLPQGPDPVDVSSVTIDLQDDFVVTPPLNYQTINGKFENENYDTSGFDSSINPFSRMRGDGYKFNKYPNQNNPRIRLARGGTYTFDLDQLGHGFYIQTRTGLSTQEPWQNNLSIRDVYGVINNGNDVGTITFNVPLKDAQDNYINMTKSGSANLVAMSSLKDRQLRYIELQNQSYADLISVHGGVDGQRFIDSKTLIFLPDPTLTATPQPWAAYTTYAEGDLLLYGNVTYRVLSPYTSGRLFNSVNLERFDPADDWYDPMPFDGDGFAFDSTNFDRGNEVPVSDRSSIFRMRVVNGLIKLTKDADIPVNTKIAVGEGIAYGNRQVYNDITNGLKVVPNITANLDFLYYQDSLDPNVNGVIEIVNQDLDGAIYVDDSIIGKTNYKSPNGVTFTNGLKIKFKNKIVPSSYADKEYYVEGVGSSIDLIPIEELVTPEIWLDSLSVTFDTVGYDTSPFDSKSSAPLTKDYITINRASKDRNAWSRINRWFHQDVIKAAAIYNGYEPVLDNTSKAKRPIVEFQPNLQIFNHGWNAKQAVNIIDTKTKDALSSVEGKAVDDTQAELSSYNSDGVPLLPNMRVIFAADTDPDVRNKIYRVSWVRPQSDTDIRSVRYVGDGSTAVFDLSFDAPGQDDLVVLVNGVVANRAGYNWSLTDTNTVTFDTHSPYHAPAAGADISITLSFKQQIHLELVDSNISLGDTVVVLQGAINEGKQFWFDGSDWILSQEKNSNNQAPLFDLVDNEGISFGDGNKYTSNTFRGNQIFGYQLSSGSLDPELGMRLKYRSIGNVGDILFSDYLSTGSFIYRDSSQSITKSTSGSRFIHRTNTGLEEYLNQWQENEYKSQQYQTQTYFATQYQKNLFLLNVIPSDKVDPLSPQSILVNINNRPINNSHINIQIEGGLGYLLLDKDLSVGDKLDIKIATGNHNTRSVYEIPQDLGSNPLNEEIISFTLGQLRDHIVTNLTMIPGLKGELNGSNNSRDLGNIKKYGGKIVQNLGSTHLANLFLNDSQANFIESVYYSQREYSRYKNKLLELLANSAFTDPNDPVATLDQAMVEISSNRSHLFPFYASDMAPYGKDYETISYVFNDQSSKIFDIAAIYDFSNPNDKALSVYHNGSLLIRGLEYNIDVGHPTVTLITDSGESFFNGSKLTLNIGDKIEFRKYNTTDGSHVPPTPTKLGLYPAFIPQLITDGRPGNTRQMLRGHDGSLTALFGDHRDAALLEFETRIYNNLKVIYSGDLHDYRDYLPGGFRSTAFDKKEFDQILSGNYAAWLGKNGLNNDEYVIFDSNDPWTWNYSSTLSKVDGNKMPAAYWRGIYKYYFDTDAPHLRPWEMLGFSDQPIWWTYYYGVAPYTRGNAVLWDDISRGYIADGDRKGIDPRYARANLLDYIPIDDSGNLLDPLSSVVKDYNRLAITGKFEFGDGSPVETAYRQSSEYPFALQIALALMQPSEYFGGNIDKNRQVLTNFGTNGKQWIYADTGLRSDVSQLVHGELDANGNIVRKNSYLTWISEYVKGLGLDRTLALGDKFRRSTVQLSYKAAGYTDKKLVKVYADQYSPSSLNSSVLIPDDDFDIVLNKSAPTQNVSYSGVIITKTSTGYSVTGYDDVKPYFTIETSDTAGKREAIKVGNVSATKFLQGNGRLQQIPYGTEFLDINQTVDFLISYGRYLSNQGFSFTEVLGEDSGFYKDWDLAAREFLFYSQQGWELGIALAVSPVGDNINFAPALGAVDGLTNKNRSTRVLSEDFKILRPEDYTVNRRGRAFSLTTTEGSGIYLLDIDVVNYEHVLVFKNKTQFNDIIFDPSTGVRQYRVRFEGYKTSNWDGSFGAPGFIINDDNVESWQAGKNYYKGDIVKFKNVYFTASEDIAASDQFDNAKWLKSDYNKIAKGILPNLANKSGQFKHFYDINSVNLESSVDTLGKGLIGMRPRSYFENLRITDTSQTKFYQGLITQKGSKNSLDKLLRAKLNNFDGSISFYEDWAVRVGQYGAKDIRQQLQLEINEDKATRDPILIELLGPNEAPTEGRISFRENDIWAKAKPFQPNFLGTKSGNGLEGYLPTAGYARLDDVNWTSSAVRNLNNEINAILVGDGDRIYVAADKNNQWSIFRTDETGIRLVNLQIAANGNMTVEFSQDHGLKEYDLILLKTTNNQPTITGFYQIDAVISNTKVMIKTSYGQFPAARIQGTFFHLVSQRSAYSSDVLDKEPINGWIEGDKLFIDYADKNGWAVYEKHEAYKEYGSYFAADPLSASVKPQALANAGFGTSMATNLTNSFLLVGQPGQNSVVTLGTKGDDLAQDLIINAPSDNVSSFGSEVTISDAGLAAVSAVDSDNGTGYVFVLKIDPKTQKFVVEQVIPPYDLDLGGHYGASVSMSMDGNWLAVGQPDVDGGYVYLYQFNEAPIRPPVTQAFIYDGSTLTFTLTGTASNPQSLDAISVSANGKTLTPVSDYTLSGNDVTLSASPVAQGGTIYVTVVRGSPEQKFVGNGSTKDFILTGDSADPASIYALKVIVDGKLMIPYRDFTLVGASTIRFQTAPILYAGIIAQQKSYYAYVDSFTSVATSTGDRFGASVNLSHDGRKLIVGAPGDNSATIDSGSAYVFDRTAVERVSDGVTASYPVQVQTPVTKVYVDDVLKVQDLGDGKGDYTLDNTGQVDFLSIPNAGSVIRIENNFFYETSRLGSDSFAEAYQKFGTSVLLCPTSCSAYIGAPYRNSTADIGKVDVGSVYRFVNQGKLYGTILSTVDYPSVSPAGYLIINDRWIYLANHSTIDQVVAAINVADIPGVMATNEDGYLRLDCDSVIAADKLKIYASDYGILSDLGLTNIYQLAQTISNPNNEEYSEFGKRLAISPDASTLVIATDMGTSRVPTAFDSRLTRFDQDTTRFNDVKAQSGEVLTYQYIGRPDDSIATPGTFIPAQRLTSSKMDSNDQFGSSIAVSNNTIFVGMPGDDTYALNTGMALSFRLKGYDHAWTMIRNEVPKVNINLINRISLIDTKKDVIITDLDYIDPYKGKISGLAAQEIDYRVSYDPAVYNIDAYSQSILPSGIVWGEEQVGRLWWNTSQVRWMEYEQGSLEYRVASWGSAFPRSTVYCLEWTESDVPPSQYSDPNNRYSFVLPSSRYSRIDNIDQNGMIKSKYYFWVGGKTTRPDIPTRNYSAADVESIIANPKAYGIPFAAFVGPNAIALYNCKQYFRNKEVVLSIDYDVIENQDNIHAEYQLVSEGDALSQPSADIVTKLIDSLAGSDDQGRLVPDIYLSAGRRYGKEFRPRQTMFVDRTAALRDAVSHLNSVLAKHPVMIEGNTASLFSDQPVPSPYINEYNESVDDDTQLGYLIINILAKGYRVLVRSDSRLLNRWAIYEVLIADDGVTKYWNLYKIQSYANTRYLQLQDWVLEGADADLKTDNIIDQLYMLDQLVPSEGMVVKVRNDGRGLYSILIYESGSWKYVVREAGTVKIKDSIWNSASLAQGYDREGFDLQQFDDWSNIETQNILKAIYHDVFVGELAVEKNNFFFMMVQHLLIEQKYVDWIFKSSFIKVEQRQRAIEQITVYQKDNQELVKQYINEVKPYHTKIREYVITYDGNDSYGGDATDFDVPAYYLSSTGTYRSPNGSETIDSFILDLAPYTPWRDNHKFYVSSIEIINGGQGFSSAPDITISGGGGTGAKAQAVVIDGSIIDIMMLDHGQGYTSTPKIELGQNSGSGAVLVARLTNDKIRKISNKIKFDRVSTPNSGFLIRFMDAGGMDVDIRNERLSRDVNQAGVIDYLLDILSVTAAGYDPGINGSWLVDDPVLIAFPVADIPNYRIMNDGSGRMQVFYQKPAEGWTAAYLQEALRALGSNVGINGLDISGTTVVLDGSMTSYQPSIYQWQPNTAYIIDDILEKNHTLYKVNADYISADSFDDTFLTKITGGDLDNHLDRTWAYYQPRPGQLGKDLGQLFSGIDYPGVQIKGANFDLEPGFGVGGYDLQGYDTFYIGPEGVKLLDPSVLDQTIYSTFTDTALGTRPEDIITQGGSFVDTYSSHAPEEMVPGRVYDTLDFRVYSTPSGDWSNGQKLGLSILQTNMVVGSNTKFTYDAPYNKADHLFTFSKQAGELIEGIDYTADRIGKSITLIKSLASDDILFIYAIDSGGAGMVFSDIFKADGITKQYDIPVDRNYVSQVYVSIDGIKTEAFTLTPSEFTGGVSTIYSTVNLTSAPSAGSSIFIYAFYNTDTTKQPWTEIYTTSKTIGAGAYPDTHTIALDRKIGYQQPLADKILVSVNGSRLQPPNQAYYVGDGSTSVYSLPTTLYVDPDLVVDPEIKITVDNVLKLVNLDWTLDASDGSTIRTITFLHAPADGAEIVVSYQKGSGYLLLDDQSLLINSSIVLSEGDKVSVTTFTNHDNIKMRSQVFKGTATSSITVSIGYDDTGFDSTAYDGDTAVLSPVTQYELSRKVTKMDYLYVTVDIEGSGLGIHLNPGIDYKMISDTMLEIGAGIGLTPSSVVTVTSFGEQDQKPSIGFRIFKDLNDNFGYYRLARENTTLLSRTIEITSDTIYVDDASVLPNPNPAQGKPGKIMIDGELIHYYQKDDVNNTLSQLRRGVAGTAAIQTLVKGTRVTDMGYDQEIPDAHGKIWYDQGTNTAANGLGLQNSTSIQAKFLLEKPTLLQSRVDDAHFVLKGYVKNGYVEGNIYD